MPSSLGPMEILAILVVALIVLGPRRLPEAGRQIGKFLSEVRRWSHNMQSEIRDVIESEPTPTTPAPTDKASTSGSAAPSPASSSAEPAGGRALTD